MANVHVTGRRVVATLIDAVLFGIVYGLFGPNFSTAHPSGFDFTQLSVRGDLGWFVLVVLYYSLLEGYLGRTVGKMLTGIRVVRESTGRPPGFGRALVRTILRIIDGFFAYLVGFVVVQASSRRRRLGDMAAGTLVVRA